MNLLEAVILVIEKLKTVASSPLGLIFLISAAATIVTAILKQLKVI